MLRSIKPPRRGVGNWEAIRDQEVRKAELEAQVELRGLQEEQRLLEARRRDVDGELERMGEPEAKIQAHRTLARWWGGLFLLSTVVAVLSAWWSVNWYLTLSWEKTLLALTLFVLPLIGWMAFLISAQERAGARDLWRIFCALGVVVILCSVIATAFLGAGRMAGTALEEDRRQAEVSRSNDELTPPTADADRASQVARVKKMLGLFTMVSVVLLGVAGEVAAGLSFHEYMRRMTVVWTVWPFYEEHASLGEDLALNTERQEEAKRRPELLHATLTAEGLREEARAELEAQEAEVRANSVLVLTKRVFIWVGLGLAVLLLAAGLAFGQTVGSGRTVVLIDLSRSTSANQEFAANLRAAEGLLYRIEPGGSLAVLGIREASFGLPPLLEASAPLAAGRFGEHLDGWRRGAVEEWHRVASGLRPSARGSDLFGGLARSAIELENANGPRRLVILSDMRQVGRGFNFERGIDASAALVQAVAQKGLVPKLSGVEVWVLGAHTAGLDEGHWNRLRSFWTGYFKLAGADLKVFSPGRRFVER